MNDHLDDAIDAVAARLTKVADNDALASQIINALPERITWFGWLFHAWAPRLAMIAVIVAAGIVWGGRGREATPGVLPIARSQPITTPTVLMASVREAEPDRTMPLERLEHLEPLEPLGSVDFERSLPSLGAVASLEFDSLAPVSLPEDAPLTLEPLAIADLLLTAEPISPR